MGQWPWLVGGASLVAIATAAAPLARATAQGVPTPATAPSASAGAPPPPWVATEVRIAPSESGWLGAWLLVGPFRSATNGVKPVPPGVDGLTTAPPGIDETSVHPSLGAAWGPPMSAKTTPPRWVIASTNAGPIDVKGTLHATDNELVAYAAGTLHVEKRGRLLLLLGVDDGVIVWVDGSQVFSRNEARPERDDDDMIPLDLAAGDHEIVLKLHQRDGAWSFHVRVLDAELNAPRGAYLALPGSSADDARDLASKMSWISVDRGAGGAGWRPTLTVRFPEGAPRGVPLDVKARLLPGSVGALTREAAAGPGASSRPALIDVAAGQVPVDASGVQSFTVDLPALTGSDFPKDDDWTYEVRVAGRVERVAFGPRHAVIQALAHADHVLPEPGAPDATWLPPASLDSLEHLRERLQRLASHGDGDLDAQGAEARELDALLDVVDKQKDPYAARTGLLRRAYRSPVDGQLAELGLYVPPGYRRSSRRTWPLIVVLHGLNGRSVAMIRYFFGGDDPKKENDWEDRHPLDPMPPLDAFVVAPSGHGNTMYRDLGEDDVMRAVQWVEQNYSIDRDRVTITGPSMGGIGSAAVPLHHPDVFAAAAPLCGYHSYFVRRDVTGRPIRPWERLLAEERSNVLWAENGERLPLWIVHGTLDLPEENSGVLIKRYEDLGFSIVHDHPELGHNVWQTTYEEMKGAKWLLQFRRTAHPRSIHFRTVRLREADDAWLHIDELAKVDAWADVSARVRGRSNLEVTTKGASAMHFDRDEKLFDPDHAVSVTVDGTALTFAPAEPLAIHMEGGAWRAGAAQHEGPFKHGEVTGPIRDAFHAPLLFVYGKSDPSQTRANEEVARAWAQIRPGVTVRYPVLSDDEFFERGEKLDNERALFLVGNAKSNRVLRALEAELPIRVEADAVMVGSERFTGPELGAAFVRPNPRRPDRYLVVVEGVDALGTWRSLSLPDLIPDFVVYDRSVAPSRGQILLSAGMARAAGFFGNDWSLPATLNDPLATTSRPGAKSEHEASPYLP
jgi:predicted esterase